MVRLSYIIKKYNPVEKDLEWEICYSNEANGNVVNECLVCEPLYRFDISAPDDAIVCYDKDELNNGIRVPQYFRFFQLLFYLKQSKIRKIVITRGGEQIKVYYNIINDLF